MINFTLTCVETIKMSVFREKIAVELYIHGLQKRSLSYVGDDNKGARVRRARFNLLPENVVFA